MKKAKKTMKAKTATKVATKQGKYSAIAALPVAFVTGVAGKITSLFK